MERKSHLKFDRVWVVFDKDEFQDFNEAIKLCETYSFQSAWTNEAFELWYYLHFQYLEASINRQDYIDKLENEIHKHSGYEHYVYKKSDSSIYKLLTTIGKESLAKRHAQKLRSLFVRDKDYEKHKPCTTVDLLVDELEHLEQLLK